MSESGPSTSIVEPHAPDATSDDAETRGTLDVRGKAVQHIVESAVRRTEGTAAHSAGLGRLGLGSSYPRADVRLQGGRARVLVDVACVWPCNVTAVAVRVRDGVLADAARLSGVEIRDVDVTVHLLTSADDNDTGRRVE